MIAKIAAAQEPDGYIYTTRTIDPKHPHRWAGDRALGERAQRQPRAVRSRASVRGRGRPLQATGKKTLLDIAIRAADLLTRTFGPGKRSIWPGHQITEMGLVKMYRVTGNEQYLALAKFMLDERGPDKIPAGETRESARARLQPGAAEGDRSDRAGRPRGSRDVHVCGHGGRRRAEDDGKMRAAGDAIWNSLVKNKLYLTGGIGAAGGHEGFGAPYDLPEHVGLQRDVRVGRHGLLEPAAVPAARRRAVRGRDGAHALQRVDLRRLARRATRSSTTTRSSRTASTRARRGSASPVARATSRGSWRRCPAMSTRNGGDTLYVNLFAGGTADVDLPGGRSRSHRRRAIRGTAP